MKKLKCKGCLKRELGCHATCEDYIEWKKENKDIQDKIREDKKYSMTNWDFNKFQ